MTQEDRNSEIHEFVLDNYPPASTWTKEEVRNWAAWAADNGCLYLCYDIPGDRGKLVGLTIARPLSIERANRVDVADTDLDADGEVVYIDLTISTAGKDPMRATMHAIMQRLGDRNLIAFKRLRTKDKIKLHRLMDFARKLIYGRR